MSFEDIFVPFWNKRLLEPPAFVSLKIKAKNPGQISAKLANLLDKMLLVLENQDLLHFDAALISRLLYRTRKNLRNDKGYKGFQKVNRILKSYLSLNIDKVIRETRSASYNDKGPSKEMLEWCLITLQRFAGLFHRLERTCSETAYYVHNHITTGNRWHLALLFLACLSRVWTLSRYLLIHVCEWYPQLKTYLDCLESKEQWLPSSHELPNDLQSWLGNPEFLSFHKRDEDSEQKSELPNQETDNGGVVEGLLFNEDFGEIVSRDGSSSVPPSQESIDFIRKPKDIERFLKNEEISRKSSRKSLTSALSDHEWKYLRNYLKKCLIEIKKLTEEEIKDKINKLKKNCFLLQLKNEVFENYLKRHDFGALREINTFLKKKFSKTSLEGGIFEEDGKTTVQLKSIEFLDDTSAETSDLISEEDIVFLIKVVEQEISELCLKSKLLKKVYEKKIVYLSGEMESYQTQVKILEKIYNVINEQYPDDMKCHAKEKRAKIADFIKFMEKMIQNVKVLIRKATLVSNDIKQEYTKLCRKDYIEEHPVLLSDIKLREIENEKLKLELSKEDQVYMDITTLRDNYMTKLKKQKSSLSKLKDTKIKLENDLQSYEKRLLSLEKYQLRLHNEVIHLEAEKKRLIQLQRFVWEVPTPRQYIEENEMNKKKIKEKKKLIKV